MIGGGRTSGTLTTDLALIVRTWDPWLAEVTGIPEADACGHALGELYPELATRGLLARLERVASSGIVEVLAPAFHGWVIPCAPREPSAHFTRMQQHVTLAPVVADGAVVGVSVTIEDVTRRLDYERELAAQLRHADDAERLQAAWLLGADRGTAGALIGALGDPSWRVRRAAVQGLATGGDERAVDALVAAVRERHRDPAVLNAAISAIARTEQDVVPRLVSLLETESADADVRTYVALALGLLEDRRAVDALVRALADPDANVRYHAIEALGRIGARETATVLAAIAESRDFSVAFAALDALALIGEPSVAPRIVPLLDDPLLQVAAAEALGRLGAEDATAPLAALLGRQGTPVASIAGALASLHDRLEEQHGEGVLVANLASAVLTPDAARNLLAALPRAGERERRGIVIVLGWVRGEGIEEALADALAHLDVRRLAADVLARRGAPAIPPLLGALQSEDEEVRKAAATALGGIGEPGAVPALIELLADHPEVAVVATGALARIGDPDALEPLLGQLDHPQAAVRQAVVGALNSIGHPDMLDRVRPLLRHRSLRVREGAVKVAGYLGCADCLDELIDLARRDDEPVRRAAIEQLAQLEHPRARAAVAEALNSGSSGVRAAAARALSHFDGGDALPLLLAACDDADPWVRYFAARSLGQHRLPSAVPTLVALSTHDAVPPVRIAAMEALAAIGDARGIDAVLPLAGDPEVEVAKAAILALGAARGRESLDVLRAALQRGEQALTVAALAALGRRASPAAVGDIAALARASDDPAVHVAAVDALARTGGEEAIAALVSLTSDPRRAPVAIAALARLGGDQVQWVGRGIAHDDPGVRCAVIEALGRRRHPHATSLLARALEDPAPAVRLAAAQALGRLDLRDAEERLDIIARTDDDPAVRHAAERALTR